MDSKELYKRMSEEEKQVFDFLLDYGQIKELEEYVRKMEEKYGKGK